MSNKQKVSLILKGVSIVLGIVFLVLCFFSIISDTKVPSDYISGLSEKFSIYPELKPAPDIVFVGSSRVYRGLWPKYVEEVLEKTVAGHKMVYNFGIGGMTAPMAMKIIDFIDEKSLKNQIVFIEPQMVFGAAFEQEVSPRSVFSNQLSTFKFGILQILAQEKGNCFVIFKRLLDYSIIFLKTGLGVSSARKTIFPPTSKIDLKLENYPALNGGIYPLDIELKDVSSGKRGKKLKRRKESNIGAKKIKKINRKLRKIKTILGDETRQITTIEKWYIDSLLNRHNSMNLKCGIVFMPMINPSYFESQLVTIKYLTENYPKIPIIYTDPHQMPELYQSQFWFDGGHLNSDGAAIYSKEVGQQLSHILHSDYMTN